MSSPAETHATLDRLKAPRQQRNNHAAEMPPSVAVFRAARALVGLSQMDLAAVSGVSAQGIARLERYPDDARLPCKRGTWQRLLGALEGHGVMFLAEDGEMGAGVRFRNAPNAR